MVLFTNEKLAMQLVAFTKKEALDAISERVAEADIITDKAIFRQDLEQKVQVEALADNFILASVSSSVADWTDVAVIHLTADTWSENDLTSWIKDNSSSTPPSVKQFIIVLIVSPENNKEDNQETEEQLTYLKKCFSQPSFRQQIEGIESMEDVQALMNNNDRQDTLQ